MARHRSGLEILQSDLAPFERDDYDTQDLSEAEHESRRLRLASYPVPVYAEAAQ